MVALADFVLIGRVAAVSEGRVFRAAEPDSEASFAWYANVALAVDRSLKGTGGSEINFEVFFPSEERYRAFLSSPPPTEQSMFFMERKDRAALRAGWSETEAAAENGYHMLVSPSIGYFRNIGGRVHLGTPEADAFISVWEGRPFQDLVSEVSAAARPGG
jgi:hypothetical protein